MSKHRSIAPKERINIVYKPANDGASEAIELPLKMLTLGDFTGAPDATPIEERRPINVDKDNFSQVMQGHDLKLQICVDDKLSEAEGATLSLELRPRTLKDFEPEGVVQQVEPLKKMLELRAALCALKGPMGNLPAFRRRIASLLGDPQSRAQLSAELGLGERQLVAPTLSQQNEEENH